MKRLVLIVLDSLGVGAMPDAKAFGDSMEVHTLRHALSCRQDTKDLPNLRELGLLSFQDHLPQYQGPALCLALPELSQGKDTVVGHWELMGVVSTSPFPVYPQGFPEDVTGLIEDIFGKAPLGNMAASGTTIISDLGPRHLETQAPILYTSSDSVLQIAFHEDLMAPTTLHQKCRMIRKALMDGPHRVNRVIARPFLGDQKNGFYRTERRKDFTIPVPEDNLLSDLRKRKIPMHALGKIQEIFSNIPFTTSLKLANNRDHIQGLLDLLEDDAQGLIFLNLLDFDSLYGHRRDCLGYGQSLEDFDRDLEKIIDRLEEGEGLILTADHGCDPLAPGSDHTREYVPFIFYVKGKNYPGYQGIGQSFADCGATVADWFGIGWNNRPGRSHYPQS